MRVLKKKNDDMWTLPKPSKKYYPGLCEILKISLCYVTFLHTTPFCQVVTVLVLTCLLKTVCFLSLALILLASSIITDNFIVSHCGDTTVQRNKDHTSSDS